MKKIKFINHKIVGKLVEPTDKGYMLLSYFLGDRPYSDDVQRIVDELTIVKSGKQTFEEVFEKYATITIGYNSGEFECDKDKAYFISNNEKAQASFDMPLQELIDLLNEWKTFLES